jgi:hypothetical protein
MPANSQNGCKILAFASNKYGLYSGKYKIEQTFKFQKCD